MCVCVNGLRTRTRDANVARVRDCVCATGLRGGGREQGTHAGTRVCIPSDCTIATTFSLHSVLPPQYLHGGRLAHRGALCGADMMAVETHR
eukprot:4908409-Prymnesium_polylepis.1